MHQNSDTYFKQKVGSLLKKMRQKSNVSINTFSREFDVDRGNLSKIERGIISLRLISAYKISQALGIKFSEFARLLEEELGEDFSLIDE